MSDFFYALLLILVVIAIFNVIIFVHELGHFLAARWRGSACSSVSTGVVGLSGTYTMPFGDQAMRVGAAGISEYHSGQF